MPLSSGTSWLSDRGRRRFGAWEALLRDETGQDLIEYALVGALIALGSVATTRGLASSLSVALEHVRTSLSQAM